jgi:hypothetical protein
VHTGVTNNDFDDAKLAIATAKRMLSRKAKVFTTFWPSMTAAQIISNSTYTDSGVTKVEIVDILNELLTL